LSPRRPESVLVLIHTVAGEVLLLRRRDPADWWQSVTGALDWHETPWKAALREVREETGFSADADLEDTGVVNTYPIIEPWTARYAPGTAENREYVFRLRLPARLDPVLDPAEHLESVWLSRTEALARATSATDRAAILANLPE
jgi:dATP pyrophosphohydrolase